MARRKPRPRAMLRLWCGEQFVYAHNTTDEAKMLEWMATLRGAYREAVFHESRSGARMVALRGFPHKDAERTLAYVDWTQTGDAKEVDDGAGD